MPKSWRGTGARWGPGRGGAGRPDRSGRPDRPGSPGKGGGKNTLPALDITVSVATSGFPTLTVASPPGGASFQWQERARGSGGAWSSSAGTGNATVTYSGVQDSKEYRCSINSDAQFTKIAVIFGFTGSFTAWTKPAQTTTVTAHLFGAQGGNASGGTTGAIGSGGYFKASSNFVTNGSDSWRVYVGGRATSSGAGSGGARDTGGFNGGGTGQSSSSIGGGGGGGATDIRNGSFALADRLAVAGGGAGQGECAGGSDNQVGDSGGGAYPSGVDGGAPSPTTTGGGGTSSAGGAAGTGNKANGGAGVLGVGGDGNTFFWISEVRSGAGGGGLYGGGGGGINGVGLAQRVSGAGGGSSGAPGSGWVRAADTSNIRTGDGVAILVY